jgi:peroxiredoxin
MLADGSGHFTKALGIELDLEKAQMGQRCQRGVFTFENGQLKTIAMEAPGKFDVSSAEACLLDLKK